MHQSFLIGLAAVSVAVISWGIQLPIAKDAFYKLDPYHLTAIRYLGAALFLVPMLVLREGWGAMRYGSDAPRLWLLGMIGMCASPMLVFIGMSMSLAEHAVIIVALQPTIAALAFWVLGKQRPEAFTLICIIAALAGVILVVTKGRFELSGSERVIIGDAIIFVGALCWVVYSMGIGRFAHFSTGRITVLTMIPGAVLTIVVTQAMVLTGNINVPTLETLGAVRWEIAYLTFVGVFAAMLAWNFGLRRVGAQNATLLINLMPVTAFAYRAWQGVRFEAIELLGVLLVVSALIVNNLLQRRQLIIAK